MIDLAQFSPQRMFLLQGDEAVFDTLLAERILEEPLTQALSVSRLTIEHARSIAAFSLEGTGEARTFIVYFSVFSPEAAQVLLKSLEEPAPLVSVIFVTRYPYLVPQTVRSRLMLLSPTEEGKREVKTKERVVAAIRKAAEEKDDDAAARRSRALILLDELESSTKHDPRAAAIVYQAKDMIFRANLPTKFVLDDVATAVR